MSDIDDIVCAARAWSGQRLALATVIESWGSAPRQQGGHMLIARDGRFAGSISGGCVEYDIFAAAEQVMAGGAATLHRYGDESAGPWEPSLPCGGEVVILVQPVGPHGFPPALFEALAPPMRRARRSRCRPILPRASRLRAMFRGSLSMSMRLRAAC